MKKQIIIVGGGNCGWITALFIRNIFPQTQYDISLIASEKIGTIGVGESTIPYVVDFLRQLGITPSDIIKNCNATLKVGVKFQGWGKDSHFTHPFTSGIGSISIQDKPLSYWYALWGKKRFNREVDIVETLIQENKVPCDIYGKLHHEYAYHIDANMLGEYIKNICIKDHNIFHIHDTVTSLEKKGENIVNIHTQNTSISNPFLVFDCSGFHELCISKYQDESPYNSFSDILPCDRALVTQSTQNYYLRNYTLSKAMKYGWRWEIPLQNRMGNGYVFSSKFCDESQVRKEFSQEINIPEEHMNLISFTSGYHKKSWIGNLVALGSSYGFVEPLEGTGIYLFCKQLSDFQKYYPQQDKNSYNSSLEKQMCEMRDFIFFHYYAAENIQSTFWNSFSSCPLPHGIKKKIEYFKKEFPDAMLDTPYNIFKKESYARVLIGMGFFKNFNFKNEKISSSIKLEITKNLINILKEKNYCKKHFIAHSDFISSCK